jgi:uncharacterized membrane protein YqjE
METASHQETPEPSGVRGLAQAGLLYMEARARLFQIEAQEAGQKLSRLAVLAIIALVFVVFAWLLLTPAAVFLIAELSGFSWKIVAAALGSVHLLIGLGCLLRLRSVAKGLRLFEESIHQCQRDRECVSQS